MLRIGEAAKRYDISNRTLRYWEEAGILRSVRMENGYRFYDDKNAARIKQIVLLRKLRMPISDIERIFIAADFGVAIDALNGHLESLKRDVAVYDSLIALVEKLMRHINESQSLEQVFSYVETQASIIGSVYVNAPKNRLSERTIPMLDERLSNVRIVKIPATTVASYRAESASPEEDCNKVHSKFVLENNLHKQSGFRQFGFNNPSPTDGSSVYGYECWVTIPEDFDVPEPLVKKQFGGGLYASISTDLSEIGERWQMLYNWCKNNNKYDADTSLQWLEECSMDYETFISGEEQQLDLLQPIKLRQKKSRA